MNCPTCGKPMLRTASGYCCEKWGCSRMQQPTDESRPTTIHQEHGDPCHKCEGKGYFYREYVGCEDCQECDGTGIYTDPSRI